MTTIALLRHMVKDEDTNLSTLFGVDVLTEVFECFGRKLEIKKVALQSRYVTAWVLNDQSCHCMRCDSSFGILKWKHHCRSCGYLVCHGCSSTKIVIPELNEGKGSRVCQHCTPQYKAVQEKPEVVLLKKEEPATPETCFSASTDVESLETVESAQSTSLEPDFSSE